MPPMVLSANVSWLCLPQESRRASCGRHNHQIYFTQSEMSDKVHGMQSLVADGGASLHLD